MPTPTEINLNNTVPAAPAGEENLSWQVGEAYPDPNNPEVPLRDVSAFLPGAAIQKGQYTYAADTGAADAYAVTLSPVPPALQAGFTVIFKAAHSNTGASTLAVNGGSPKAIKKNVSSALASGDILANQIVAVLYDGTNFQMLGGAGGGGVTLPIAESDVTGLVSDLALKAPLASPALTGAPTAPTQTTGDDSTKIATTAFVEDALDNLSARKVGITIDGFDSVISTGVKGSIQVDFAGTIIGWSIEADQAGDITVEVDKHASSAPPAAPAIPNTTTDKISASAPIALSAAQSAAAAAAGVSTWTTAVAQWDSIQFKVASAATLKRVALYLRIQES